MTNNQEIICLYEKIIPKIRSEIKGISEKDLESFSNLQEDDISFQKIPKSMVGDKTVLQWFSIDEKISYWWLVYATINPKYKEAITFIDRIEKLIFKLKPKKIILCGYFDKISIIQEICNINKIELEISNTNYIKYEWKRRITKYTKKIRYKKLNDKKIAKRLEIYENNLKKIPSSPYTIITGINRRVKGPNLDGKITEQDFSIQPIMELISKSNKKLLCIDIDYSLKGEYEYLTERVKTKFNWTPIDYFLKNANQSETKQIIETLQKSIKKMKESNIEKIFMYKEISLWKILEPIIDEIFYEPYLPTYINLISAFDYFFSKNKPEVVIQVYEVGPYAKAIEIAAQKNNVKTIGIQHGGMVGDQTDYLHQEIQSKKIPLGNPIPEQTFLFGEFHKEFLTTKGKYPKNQLVVTGNPMYLGLEKFKENFNKEKNLKLYNNIEDKKIILVLLSYRINVIKGRNYDEVLLDSIYSNYKNKKNVQIIIRPHPGDKIFNQEYIDKHYPSSNFICSKHSLFEDILTSDLIVLTRSTAGVEAVLFEKPVVFVSRSMVDNENFEKIMKIMEENDLITNISVDKIKHTIDLFLKKYEDSNNKTKQNNEFIKYFFNYGKDVDLMELIYDKGGKNDLEN